MWGRGALVADVAAKGFLVGSGWRWRRVETGGRKTPVFYVLAKVAMWAKLVFVGRLMGVVFFDT